LVFVVATASGRIVIRPSDHVLAGAGYDLREFEHENEIVNDQPVRVYHIMHPGDVAIDPNYESDFWGVVDFKPVPVFSIDTHDPVSQDTFISASVHSGSEPWDVYVWNALVSALTKNSTPGHHPSMVDVGANLGYFSLAAASLGARVVAFEPMSRNARKLSKSIYRNRFEDRITLYQNAVWREGDSMSVRLDETDPSNQGNGRMSAAAREGQYGIDYVNTVSLSELIHHDVDVIKIDTEGTEDAVIAGAKGLICAYRVKHIVMEFTEVKKRGAKEMLSFLTTAGYSVSDVTPDAPKLDVADFESFPPNILFTLHGDAAVC
jgi:FkbM family methyltransferase